VDYSAQKRYDKNKMFISIIIHNSIVDFQVSFANSFEILVEKVKNRHVNYPLKRPEEITGRVECKRSQIEVKEWVDSVCED
jgi:hypothetical protein